MIENKAIREFFDAEAEAQKASWEATMSLPLKERIRKRKAIDNVTVDKNYSRESEEGNLILKIDTAIKIGYIFVKALCITTSTSGLHI